MFIAFLAVGFLHPISANAGLITISPDAVNRLIDYPYFDLRNQNFNDYFSTYQATENNQRTLLFTSGNTFHNALINALGAGYVINEVTLTVGSSTFDEGGFGPYASQGAKGAYKVLTAYNTDTVSWNSFNNGGVAGTNYETTATATGVISGDTTVWTFSPTLINDWINSPTSNLGLFFPDYGTWEDNKDTTRKENVVWTVNATAAVPEPCTLALVGIGAGVCGLFKRRRRKIAQPAA